MSVSSDFTYGAALRAVYARFGHSRSASDRIALATDVALFVRRDGMTLADALDHAVRGAEASAYRFGAAL